MDNYTLQLDEEFRAITCTGEYDEDGKEIIESFPLNGIHLFGAMLETRQKYPNATEVGVYRIHADDEGRKTGMITHIDDFPLAGV